MQSGGPMGWIAKKQKELKDWPNRSGLQDKS
jgi:hypothetical protein